MYFHSRYFPEHPQFFASQESIKGRQKKRFPNLKFSFETRTLN